MTKFLKPGKKMKIGKILFIVTFILTCTHCASYDFSRRVVEQGNLLPQDKINRLKEGMHKNEVALLLGTSLLSPTFNEDRWDYAYTIRKGNSNLTVQSLSLYFSHGVLRNIVRGKRPFS